MSISRAKRIEKAITAINQAAAAFTEETKNIIAALEEYAENAAPAQDYMTKSAAGRFLGRSEKYVRDAIKEGYLACSDTGLLRREDLVAFAESGMSKGMKRYPMSETADAPKGTTFKRVV